MPTVRAPPIGQFEIDLGDGYRIVDLGDEHLERWRQTGEASQRELASIRSFTPKWLAERRADRSPWDSGRVPREVVTEDSDHRLLMASVLYAGTCPINMDDPGVSVHYAVHPDCRSEGHASRTMAGLVRWGAKLAGYPHVHVEVCTLNEASLRTARRAGLRAVKETSPCDAAGSQGRHRCNNRELHLCSGDHDDPDDELPFQIP